MLRNCEPVILFEEENTYIAKCQSCHRVSLSFNNLLLGFTSSEFKTLGQLILKLDFQAASINFPDGRPRIVLNTGHKDIQCSFDPDEFTRLKKALTESFLLLDAHAILHHNHP